MRTPLRFGLALVLAGLALAACSNRLNLISRRAYYDSFLDLPGRGQAVANQDAALLRSILGQCDSPDEAPYPLLQADVDAMQRQAGVLEVKVNALKSFERDYDRFANAQGTVSPDEVEPWGRYRALDARFQPMGQAMRLSLQALNASHADFESRLQDAGIALVDADDLRREVDAFTAELDRTLASMDRLVRELRERMRRGARMDGRDRDRWAALKALQRALADNVTFGRKAAGAALDLRNGLPDQGSVYYGPGLPGGDGLAQLRQDEESLHARAKDFEDQRRALEEETAVDTGGPGWQGQSGGYGQGGPAQGGGPVSYGQQGGQHQGPQGGQYQGPQGGQYQGQQGGQYQGPQGGQGHGPQADQNQGQTGQQSGPQGGQNQGPPVQPTAVPTGQDHGSAEDQHGGPGGNGHGNGGLPNTDKPGKVPGNHKPAVEPKKLTMTAKPGLGRGGWPKKDEGKKSGEKPEQEDKAGHGKDGAASRESDSAQGASGSDDQAGHGHGHGRQQGRDSGD